jgi:hypothetical protein
MLVFNIITSFLVIYKHYIQEDKLGDEESAMNWYGSMVVFIFTVIVGIFYLSLKYSKNQAYNSIFMVIGYLIHNISMIWLFYQFRSS